MKRPDGRCENLRRHPETSTTLSGVKSLRVHVFSGELKIQHNNIYCTQPNTSLSHNAEKLSELSSVRVPLSQVLRPSPISPEGDIGSGESPFPCRPPPKTVIPPSWVRGLKFGPSLLSQTPSPSPIRSVELNRPREAAALPMSVTESGNPSRVRGSCNILINKTHLR